MNDNILESGEAVADPETSEEEGIVPENDKLVLRRFDEKEVRLIQHESDLWITSDALGEALGYDDPKQAMRNLYARNRDELEPYSLMLKVEREEGGRKVFRTLRVFNEEGTIFVCLFSDQEIAKRFRRWAVSVMKAYRHGEMAMSMPDKSDKLLIECIRESGKGNIAAIDILVNKYGFSPDIESRQMKAFSIRLGKEPPENPASK